MTKLETIDSSGFPIAFKTRQGSTRSPLLTTAAAERDVFVTEVRSLSGYQKEAIVTEGKGGSSWRLTTDEGKHIKGTDLAPFPLGFFNAGLHADLIKRILVIAKRRDIIISDIDIKLQNFYFLDGSFVKGDGIGGSKPAKINVNVQTDSSASDVKNIVNQAILASPALATMRQAVTNTFAIYVNSRRHEVTTLKNSKASDAADPYLTYSTPPSPLAGAGDLPNLIKKTGEVTEGEIVDVSDGTIRRVVRTVSGTSHLT